MVIKNFFRSNLYNIFFLNKRLILWELLITLNHLGSVINALTFSLTCKAELLMKFIVILSSLQKKKKLFLIFLNLFIFIVANVLEAVLGFVIFIFYKTILKFYM